MSKIAGILMGFFILWSTLMICPSVPVDIWFSFECTVMGVLGFLVVVWKMPKYMWIFIAPWIIAAMLSGLNWRGSYSEHELTVLAGLTLLMIFVSQCKTKWILRAMLISTTIHIGYSYCIFDWAYQYGSCYNWGLWRNSLRYASWLYAGIVCALAMLETEKKRLWKIFARAIIAVALWQIISCTAVALTGIAVLTVLIYIGYKTDKMYTIIAFVTLGVAFAVFFLLSHNSYSHFHPRIILARHTLKLSFDGWNTLIGHGIGAYQLNVACHPHNQLLDILYNQGIIGVFVALIFFASVIMLSLGSGPVVVIGIIGLAISTCTNSMRYPDVAFCFTLLCGLGLSQIGQLDNAR
jgi:hypothetical protein